MHATHSGTTLHRATGCNEPRGAVCFNCGLSRRTNGIRSGPRPLTTIWAPASQPAEGNVRRPRQSERQAEMARSRNHRFLRRKASSLRYRKSDSLLGFGRKWRRRSRNDARFIAAYRLGWPITPNGRRPQNPGPMIRSKPGSRHGQNYPSGTCAGRPTATARLGRREAPRDDEPLLYRGRRHPGARGGAPADRQHQHRHDLWLRGRARRCAVQDPHHFRATRDPVPDDLLARYPAQRAEKRLAGADARHALLPQDCDLPESEEASRVTRLRGAPPKHVRASFPSSAPIRISTSVSSWAMARRVPSIARRTT